MRAAIYRAIDIFFNRQEYAALTRNPLKVRHPADAHQGEDEDIDMSKIED